MRIVFAHFYSPIPKHLELNLRRISNQFPEHQVFLITDRQDFNPADLKITVHIYNPSLEWHKVEFSLNHPKFFRSNFWFTSLARFIAISEFTDLYPGSLLHIESDVILADDFPFARIEQSGRDFAFPIVSNEQAIASTLYFRSSHAAKKLAQLTLDESLSNPSTTDMHILRRLYDIANDKVQILPSAPVDKHGFVSGSIEMNSKFREAVDFFGGVFDGFDLGQYLLGIDPRNRRGRSVVRSVNDSHYIDSRKLEFSMSSGRDFPNIYDYSEMKPIPLYSLHVHSKNLRLFREKSSKKAIRNSVLESPLRESMTFYPRVFIRSFLTSLKRRIQKCYSNLNEE
jgi:hypothetical protein